MTQLLAQTLADIKALDPNFKAEAQTYLDTLAKPVGSIGRLEELSVQIAAIQGSLKPSVDTSTLLVCAGDHGIVATGVAPFPQDITTLMVSNFAKSKSCVNQFALATDTKVSVFDVGVKNPTSDIKGVHQVKVRPGTANFLEEAALSPKEVIQTLETGIREAIREIEEGADLLCIGEMGIGNSTTAAALVAAFSGADIRSTVGAGTGLNAEGIALKNKVIAQSFERAGLKEGNPVTGFEESLRVLSELGGLEIIMMSGIILGAASRSIPLIADGFISGASVLSAHALCPASIDYVIFSHQSAEPGHAAMYAYLKANPLLSLDMRLGEGTGAVLCVPFVKAAANMMSGMATLEETMS